MNTIKRTAASLMIAAAAFSFPMALSADDSPASQLPPSGLYCEDGGDGTLLCFPVVRVCYVSASGDTVCLMAPAN